MYVSEMNSNEFEMQKNFSGTPSGCLINSEGVAKAVGVIKRWVLLGARVGE